MLTLAGDNLLDFLRSENFILFTAITLGCLVGMVSIVSRAVSGTMKARAREQTRRELAAYVAEGTMEPDKAVAILNAGVAPKDEQELA